MRKDRKRERGKAGRGSRERQRDGEGESLTVHVHISEILCTSLNILVIRSIIKLHVVRPNRIFVTAL